jgi:hypothetical protein
MKTAIIPPIPDLDLARGRHYHLLLSHLCHFPEYRDFYRNVEGYRILDNGAHENQAGEGPEHLLRLAEEIGVDEIVCPDYLFDADRTVALTGAALKVLACTPGKRYRLMVVPQGSSLTAYRRCLLHLLELWEEHAWHRDLTIGVSKDYEEFPGGLLRLLEKDIIPLADEFSAEIHLLGWGRKATDLWEISRTFGERIRSIDSAKPVVYARYNQLLPLPWSDEFPSYPGRPRDYFTTPLTPEQRRGAIKNIVAFERWANESQNT